MFKSLILSSVLCLYSINSFADVLPGDISPDFKLKNLDAKEISLSDFKGKYVVLEWFNKDCPFVKKHYESNNMQNLQETYTKKDVVWLMVNSSNVGQQGNEAPVVALETLKKLGAKQTHYLIDEDGKVGKLFGAKTTPHMYILDKNHKVIYTGAIDSIASADKADLKAAKNYVANTLDLSMAGKEVDIKNSKAYGCNVKY